MLASSCSATPSTQVRCPEDPPTDATDYSNIWPTEHLPTTASRIESTGMRERIHLSEQTAMELIKHGKQDWMVRRDDTVEAKGKGELVTYWLKLNSDRISAPSTVASSEVGTEGEGSERAPRISDFAHAVPAAPRGKTSRKKLSSKANQKIQRLVDWNSELLLQLLKRVVARRGAFQSSTSTCHVNLTEMARDIGARSMIVNEVAEIIQMPAFVSANCIADVHTSDDVAKQLHSYVAKIASMYNDNPCKFGRKRHHHHFSCRDDSNTIHASPPIIPSVHNFEHVRSAKYKVSSSRPMAVKYGTLT